MINYIWLGIMWLSFISALLNNKMQELSLAVTEGAKSSIEMLISISGMIIFWGGIVAIAENAGLVDKLGKLMYPVLKYLFPDVPKDHPAMGFIVMVISANALGMNNAATPIGVSAMQALQTINDNPEEASDDMCMLVTINASSIQIIPSSTIGFLAAYGSQQPSKLLFPVFIATVASTAAGIFSVLLFRRWYKK